MYNKKWTAYDNLNFHIEENKGKVRCTAFLITGIIITNIQFFAADEPFYAVVIPRLLRTFSFQSRSTSYYNYDFLPIHLYWQQFRGIYELTRIMLTATQMRCIVCFELQDAIKQVDFSDFKISVIYTCITIINN